jgi:hypothetical protein
MITDSAFLRIASFLSIRCFLAGCGSRPRGASSLHRFDDEQQTDSTPLSVDDRKSARVAEYRAKVMSKVAA